MFLNDPSCFNKLFCIYTKFLFSFFWQTFSELRAKSVCILFIVLQQSKSTILFIYTHNNRNSSTRTSMKNHNDINVFSTCREIKQYFHTFSVWLAELYSYLALDFTSTPYKIVDKTLYFMNMNEYGKRN